MYKNQKLLEPLKAETESMQSIASCWASKHQRKPTI